LECPRVGNCGMLQLENSKKHQTRTQTRRIRNNHNRRYKTHSGQKFVVPARGVTVRPGEVTVQDQTVNQTGSNDAAAKTNQTNVAKALNSVVGEVGAQCTSIVKKTQKNRFGAAKKKRAGTKAIVRHNDDTLETPLTSQCGESTHFPQLLLYLGTEQFRSLLKQFNRDVPDERTRGDTSQRWPTPNNMNFLEVFLIISVSSMTYMAFFVSKDDRRRLGRRKLLD